VFGSAVNNAINNLYIGDLGLAFFNFVSQLNEGLS